MHDPAVAAEEIVRACRRLDARGLIAGTEGNVSARLVDRTVLMTPAGVAKHSVTAQDLVRVGPDGEPLGSGRASTEVRMHLAIYRRRHDVHAIVHAHPPAATAFAVAGEGLVAPVLPEIIFTLGAVPLVPYAQPGTEALPAAIEPYLDGHDALLLANHGATTMGRTVEEALSRMEAVEHAARILLGARMLGRVVELRPADVAALRAAAVAARDEPGT